jgi:hypothetical protein
VVCNFALIDLTSLRSTLFSTRDKLDLSIFLISSKRWINWVEFTSSMEGFLVAKLSGIMAKDGAEQRNISTINRTAFWNTIGVFIRLIFNK